MNRRQFLKAAAASALLPAMLKPHEAFATSG
ncbi:MAG: twin-arginine translocation signal domain-containing protein [Candidatus Binataceae bacterium]